MNKSPLKLQMEKRLLSLLSSRTIVNNESGTININQVDRYTNLKDDNTLHVYKEISYAEQGKFITRFVVVCLIPGISLVADFMQIHPAINLPFWAYFISFFIIFVIVIGGFYDNIKILFSEQPNENECRQLYEDKLFSKTDNGYIIFTHTNDCIYPDCTGKIRITSPPERYNGEYSFFGKYSITKGQHSYGIDYNFKAYPIKVDWRPEPIPNK